MEYQQLVTQSVHEYSRIPPAIQTACVINEYFTLRILNETSLSVKLKARRDACQIVLDKAHVGALVKYFGKLVADYQYKPDDSALVEKINWLQKVIVSKPNNSIPSSNNNPNNSVYSSKEAVYSHLKAYLLEKMESTTSCFISESEEFSIDAQIRSCEEEIRKKNNGEESVEETAMQVLSDYWYEHFEDKIMWGMFIGDFEHQLRSRQ